MSNPTVRMSAETLTECVELAKDPTAHQAAEQAFEKVKQDLSGVSDETLQVMEHLWKELLTARRSAAFWEKISNVERSMTEQLAADHFQLKQNYLRLLQEQ